MFSMTHSCRVAGHHFKLVLQDGDPLSRKLDAYRPFECASDENVLFCLEVVSEMEEPEVEMLYDEDPEGDQSKISIGRYDSGWWVEMSPLARMKTAGKLMADSDFRNARLLISERSQDAFALNSAVMLLFAFCSAPLDTLEMHASVVSNGGKGYLFLGKSGTGKSTHSRLWLRHIEGSELMNDDNPVIRIMEDGTPTVFGTPWSGKTPCYRNVSAPIGAIVSLRQEKFNRIERLPVTLAYAALYSSCSSFRPIKSIADGLHSTISRIIPAVPCYRLDCLPDEDAARVCAAAVRKEDAR